MQVGSLHRRRRFLRTPLGPAVLALSVGCSVSGGAQLLELDTCTNSPTELLRLEGTAAGLSIDAFDLGDAISVRYALQSESDPSSFRYPETFSVVDNCGGEPLRIADSFGLPSGAANVGGEVVLCAGREYLGGDGSVWQLLDDGTRGEDLGLGTRCSRANPGPGVREPSFGIVYDDAGIATQHLPDGTERVVSDGRNGFDLLTTTDGAAVFTYGANAAVHPADGSPTIQLDLPEAVFTAYPAPGAPFASHWVVAVARERYPSDTSPIVGYAVDLRTGQWFETPALIPEASGMHTPYSLRDGLMATDTDDGLMLSRAGWERHLRLPLSSTGSTFAVLDADRVFVIDNPEQIAGAGELRIVEVARELPAEDVDFEPNVLWSRPLGADEVAVRGAGFGWNDMALVESGDEVLAYPLDGRPAFPFVPRALFTYVGGSTITGLGIPPDSDDDKLWLFERSFDGEFEVIADDLTSGQDDLMGHPWTPELGRILYSVRDGDSVSIRQHRIAP